MVSAGIPLVGAVTVKLVKGTRSMSAVVGVGKGSVTPCLMVVPRVSYCSSGCSVELPRANTLPFAILEFSMIIRLVSSTMGRKTTFQLMLHAHEGKGCHQTQQQPISSVTFCTSLRRCVLGVPCGEVSLWKSHVYEIQFEKNSLPSKGDATYMHTYEYDAPCTMLFSRFDVTYVLQ